MAKNKLERQAMYYSATANAYKYDSSAEEYYLQQEEQQTAVQPAPKAKRKLKPAAAIAAAAVLCLALGTMRVVQYERMSAASLRVNKLKSTIATIEEEIETLNVKLEYAMDINTVQLIARDELGMDYPEHEQVVSAIMAPQAAQYAARAASVEQPAQQGEGPSESAVRSVPQYAAVPVSVQEEQGGE